MAIPRIASFQRGYSSHASVLPNVYFPSGAARLSSRRLLAIFGADARTFLHGIITKLPREDSPAGVYAAFLNAKGRVLNDVFVYPAEQDKSFQEQFMQNNTKTDPGFFVEVDANEADALLRHFKRYKLRSKFNIRLVEDQEWSTWSTWTSDSPWTIHTAELPKSCRIGCTDTRAPRMGQRLVLPAKSNLEQELEGLEEAPLQAYALRRIMRGVAEGQGEMPREASLPHEYNIDLMGGIDFKKGCYVGQELTIRTQHRGVVRKRVLPLAMYTAGVPVPEELEYDSRSNISEQVQSSSRLNILPISGAESRTSRASRGVGTLITSLGNVGLGLVRLERMTDLRVTADPLSFSPATEFALGRSPEDDASQADLNVQVKAFVPDWVRNSVEARAQRNSQSQH